MTSISSHNREDERLLQIFHDVADGFYVDVGGYSPDISSNTNLLYKHGWSGLIVEPLLSLSDELMQQWQSLRPRDLLAPCIASNRDNDMLPFYACHSERGLAQMSTASKRLIDSWRNDFRVGEPTATIRTLTLDSLLSHVTTPQDMKALSIDVEGMEEEVLAGLDLTVWRPWVMVVEKLWSGSAEVRLNSFAYRWVHNDKVNDWFVAEEHADRVPLFQLEGGP